MGGNASKFDTIASKFNTISMVMVTKINTKITTNVIVTIAMLTNNFVQGDLISVVSSPIVIKKPDNVNC